MDKSTLKTVAGTIGGGLAYAGVDIIGGTLVGTFLSGIGADLKWYQKLLAGIGGAVLTDMFASAAGNYVEHEVEEVIETGDILYRIWKTSHSASEEDE